jgi:hypothetical protein
LLLRRCIPNVAPHFSAAAFSPLPNIRGSAIVAALHAVLEIVLGTDPPSSSGISFAIVSVAAAFKAGALLLLCLASSIPPIHPAISARSSSDVCDSFHS